MGRGMKRLEGGATVKSQFPLTIAALPPGTFHDARKEKKEKTNNVSGRFIWLIQVALSLRFIKFEILQVLLSLKFIKFMSLTKKERKKNLSGRVIKLIIQVRESLSSRFSNLVFS